MNYTTTLAKRSPWTLTKTGSLSLVFVVGIFANTLEGMMGIGYLYNVIFLFIVGGSLVFSGAWIGKLGELKRGVFLPMFLLFLLSSASLVTGLSSFYEFLKLTIFLSLIPCVILLGRRIDLFEVKLLRLCTAFLCLNLFVIALQYLISPYIITYFGFPISQIENAQKYGRWIGFFESVNGFADVAFFIFLLNELVGKSHPSYKKVLYISCACVLISTSKHAVLMLALYFVFMTFINRKRLSTKKMVKFFLLTVVSLSLLLMSLYLLSDAYVSKYEQYTYFAKNITNIQTSDAKHIEKRALYMGTAISIAKNHPHGVGLGVWGDASARYSDKVIPGYQENEMADSAFAHILVEQGWKSLIYVFLVFSCFFLVATPQKGFFIFLFSCYVILVLSTMALSSGGWPLLFAYIYARLFCSRTIPIARNVVKSARLKKGIMC